ncbi:hypothetical protein [Burkholderia ubonensis]|uniref:hypothetical protein n=1 Tax=Burkholderia ubonensis TaxID=101571 RepID=UPI0012FC9B17|nr:hypothetical protein [Burkholderia ubonensis]
MPARKRRVVEIQHGLPLHADTLHQAPRSEIGIRRPREDVRQPDPLKPVGQYARRQRMTVPLLVMPAAEADQQFVARIISSIAMSPQNVAHATILPCITIGTTHEKSRTNRLRLHTAAIRNAALKCRPRRRADARHSFSSK